MRTIRTVTEQYVDPCPECGGKRSHKLDCSTGATGAGSPLIRIYDASEVTVMVNGVPLANGFEQICYEPVRIYPADKATYHAELSRGSSEPRP